MRYALFAQRYRVLQDQHGTYVPQWRVWWLPFWSAFDAGEHDYGFNTLEAARKFIREEQKPRPKPQIFTA